MIDSETKSLLSSNYAARKFFLFIAIPLVIVLASSFTISAITETDYILLNYIQSVANEISSTLFIILIFSVFYVWITPKELRNAQLIPLKSAEISENIVDLPNETDTYYFWGRSGTYFRTKVLPRLDNQAQEHRLRTTIHIILPDPEVETSATLYRRFKQSLGESSNSDELKLNVLMTLTSAANLTVRNPYITVHAGLSPTVPVVRYDMSTKGALLTRDAKKLPAIFIGYDTPYFDMFKDAFLNEFEQCRPLDQNHWHIFKDNLACVKPEDIKTAFGINATRELLDKASHRIKNDSSRYDP